MKKRKHLFYLLLCIGFITACSNFDEEMKVTVADFETLSFETIETKLKVINLNVVQREFDEMYFNFQEKIEVEGTIDVYENKNLLFGNEEIELEVKGTSSAGFSLKSLGIEFEDSYNNSAGNLISTGSLPWHSLSKIKAIRLRNSGNDFKESMIKDLTLTRLAIDAKLDIDLTYAEQVVVFINDEFYGLMNFRTEANAKGIAKKYQVDKDRITLAKVIAGGVVVKKNGDEDRIDNFFTAIAEKDYEYLLAEVEISNFIDYMIFESYIGNEDWPKNNVRMFSIDDRPFRFILFDLDFVHSIGLKASPKDFINAEFYPTDANPIGDLFNIFYENESFKLEYDNRYFELLNSGLLSSDKYDEIVNAASSKIETLMPVQIQKHQSPETFLEWNLHVDKLRENFKIRENYLKRN